jgi:hypothetical protein
MLTVNTDGGRSQDGPKSFILLLVMMVLAEVGLKSKPITCLNIAVLGYIEEMHSFDHYYPSMLIY